MNNYILYSTDNMKVKRQAISSKDIYPAYAASQKIPGNAEQIARIVTKPCYQCETSTWYKHSLIGPTVDRGIWNDNQKEFKRLWSEKLTNQELELLSQ